MPLAFHTTLDTIPAEPGGYLAADPVRVAAWQAKLGERRGKRVGLVWSGNPGHPNDYNRSLPLTALLPMLGGDAQFVSLHRDVRPADQAVLAQCGSVVADYAADLTDFAETAALVANLDLVVAVDSAVAHLTGALGKPLWLLLPFNCDWRWLTWREDSPWYPTARLFRQPTLGDWASVVARLVGELGLPPAPDAVERITEAGRNETALADVSDNNAASGVELPPATPVELPDVGPAIALHQQGRLAEAEAAYRQVLQRHPGHAEALHMLGVIALQTGHLQAAVELIGQALATRPDLAEAHSNHGVALLQLLRHEDALASFDRSLRLKPDFIDALNNRGNALREMKRPNDALESYDRALRLQPDNAVSLNNRGLVLLDLNRPQEALTCFDRILLSNPNDFAAHHLRGNALKSLKRLDEALACYDRALRIKPDYVDALFDRGIVLGDQNRLEDALACFAQALTIRQDWLEAFLNQGHFLYRLRRFDEALLSFEGALQIDPHHAEAHFQCGNALLAQDRPEEALTCYEQAVEFNPLHVNAQNQRIGILFRFHRYVDIVKLISEVEQVVPHFNLGNKLHAQMHCYDWLEYKRNRDAVLQLVQDGKPGDMPFSFLSVSDALTDQLQVARMFMDNTKQFVSMPALWKGRRYRHDKIRVAYLSPDFRNHPVATLIVRVLEVHDKNRFETVGVSFGPQDGSEVSARVRGAFDHFVEVRGETDEAVAKRLREMEIDIAVDLAGHTTYSRPLILAHRPAPVQINYLGFPGTMGVDYMDYILADDFVIPPESRQFYTEQVIYLPDCFQANDNQKRISPKQPLRTQVGLPDSGFVFCSFNTPYKCNPVMFDVWMRLLQAVEGSVLWVLAGSSIAENNLRLESAKRGVDPARLVFAFRMNYSDHLARLQLADLFLDTLPFNAGTTASDALWAGVPLVTCAGESFAARMAGSLVRAVGLPELITKSLPDYEALAFRLATTPDLLGEIKARLAQNRTTFPLFDTERFCRNLESAYVSMWQRYQRGEPPKGFAVKPVK